MVISHKYNYLFVELPLTASTAIQKELCQYYDGVSVLHKHATYREFLRTTEEDVSSYFVFSGIRNPLDLVVTTYVKYKTDFRGFYSDRGRLESYSSHPKTDWKRFQFIQRTGADFPTFLKKFYRFPYDNWSRLDHKKFDYVIRFENLQADFAYVLEQLGLEQKRDLPVANPTPGKKDFLSYYTPEVYDLARRVFGPFMEEWGYSFPSEWGDDRVPWRSKVTFELLGLFREHFQWGGAPYVRLSGELIDRLASRL